MPRSKLPSSPSRLVVAPVAAFAAGLLLGAILPWSAADLRAPARSQLSPARPALAGAAHRGGNQARLVHADEQAAVANKTADRAAQDATQQQQQEEGGAPIALQPPGNLQGPGPAAAAAAAGLQRNDPPLGERSRRWAPMVLNRCTPDMPRHYAPCLVGSAQDPHVVYAEELIYPDFSLPEPHFLSEEHAAFWRSTVTGQGDYLLERFALWHGRAYYTGQRGQNIVLRNVSFQNKPRSDSWDHDACTKPATTHRLLTPLPEGQAPQWKGRAVLVTTPDGGSFQHFMDRLTNVLFQDEGWRLPGTKVGASGHPKSQHVSDLWPLLTDGQEVIHGTSSFSVQELVFSCRTPYRHPFFRMRLHETVGLPDPAPLEERRVVMYFSRNHGGTKPERSVTNEEAVLQAIRDVLTKRNRGEELVVMPPASFPHALDLARYLRANVSAVIAPHGGAMTNLIWAAPETLVIEFSPSSRPHHMFWAESSLVGCRFWCIIVNTTAPEHRMTVDPEQVAGVLRKELGQHGTPEDYIMPYYFWENTLEGQINTDGWR